MQYNYRNNLVNITAATVMCDLPIVLWYAEDVEYVTKSTPKDACHATIGTYLI